MYSVSIKSCETMRVRPRVTAKGCDNDDDDDVGNDNTTNDDTTFDHDEGHVECDAIVCVCLFAPPIV